MLLLVLILVLIAFGLLVVGMLTGAVLWAYISIAVSVGAGVVWLVDFLHQRSAVKAGDEAAAPARPPGPAGGPWGGSEPVTEFIPVTPPGAAPSRPPAGPAGRVGPGAPFTGGDGEQTVALPIVQPSGSPGRPPGATPEIASPTGSSSLSVTKPGSGGPADPAFPAGSGQPTAGPGEGAADERPAGAQGTPQAGVSAEPGGRPETAEPSAGAAGAPAGHEPDGGTSAPGSAAAGGAQGGPSGAPPGAGQAMPPLGPDGAPPEEPRDAEAAALVAELEDEVLVVDELPRYHLFGCRSLLGRAVIPLPAKEAVELGFTPCGWCTPDRSLYARHPAGAR
ncbi:MAG TPA: hypothetical protein VD813_00875 [Pseudonocardia sp.]|nr:hypothetical protein [Pseudonocardia sp.]